MHFQQNKLMRNVLFGSKAIVKVYPGVGNGNPLQYSCLENSMDRGPWRSTIPGAAKSWTRLSTHTCKERKDRCENLEIKSVSVGEGQDQDERSGRPNLELRTRPKLWKRLMRLYVGRRTAD